MRERARRDQLLWWVAVSAIALVGLALRIVAAPEAVFGPMKPGR